MFFLKYVTAKQIEHKIMTVLHIDDNAQYFSSISVVFANWNSTFILKQLISRPCCNIWNKIIKIIVSNALAIALPLMQFSILPTTFDIYYIISSYGVVDYELYKGLLLHQLVGALSCWLCMGPLAKFIHKSVHNFSAA